MTVPKTTIVAAAALILITVLTPGPVMAQAMKSVGDTIDLPAEKEPAPLSGLSYYYPLKVEFTAVTWVVKESKGDTLKIHWTLDGASGRARPQRTRLKMDCLNAAGDSVKNIVKMVIFKPSTDNQKFEFDLKIKKSDWEATKKLRFQASFLIGA